MTDWLPLFITILMRYSAQCYGLNSFMAAENVMSEPDRGFLKAPSTSVRAECWALG